LSDVRQVRDDYQELIELTLLILGYPLPQIHWRSPGPVHHARWMAKLLYALKIMLLRNQSDVFKLTNAEEKGLKRFALFGALIYTRTWTKAPLAADAPLTDLQLWLDLQNYEKTDPEISKAAKSVLARHMWYLSDECVGLAFFSDLVSSNEKEKMVSALAKEPENARNVRGDSNKVNEEMCLADFVNTRSKKLFERFDIDMSFLSSPPSQWDEIEAYQVGMSQMQKLRVVNDTAERGVKLFKEFNTLLTKDEQEKQFLLQVVEANRKTVPTEATKSGVISGLAKA
jgi:hypothetical protein